MGQCRQKPATKAESSADLSAKRRACSSSAQDNYLKPQLFTILVQWVDVVSLAHLHSIVPSLDGSLTMRINALAVTAAAMVVFPIEDQSQGRAPRRQNSVFQALVPILAS